VGDSHIRPYLEHREEKACKQADTSSNVHFYAELVNAGIAAEQAGHLHGVYRVVGLRGRADRQEHVRQVTNRKTDRQTHVSAVQCSLGYVHPRVVPVPLTCTFTLELPQPKPLAPNQYRASSSGPET
jgi:hypothetical protein